MAGQRNVGHGDGSMSYLPNYVHHEPYDHNKVYYKHQRIAEHQYHFKNSVEEFHMHSKTNMKMQHRARYNANWAFAGPGMQAIFLDSGRRSCGGTGVFLPQQRRVGTGASAPSKKPASAPTVLLPTRVVEALNINVQELSFQLSHNKSTKTTKGRKEDQTLIKSTKDDNEDTLSPELLLPKEWTY